MGRWLHTIAFKASSDGKSPTKSQLEIIERNTIVGFIPFLNDDILQKYYRRLSLHQDVEWNIDRSDYRTNKTIKLVADVYTHPQHDALDHWLELFITRLSNLQDIGRSTHQYIADTQLEIMRSPVNYRDMLTVASADKLYFIGA